MLCCCCDAATMKEISFHLFSFQQNQKKNSQFMFKANLNNVDFLVEHFFSSHFEIKRKKFLHEPLLFSSHSCKNAIRIYRTNIWLPSMHNSIEQCSIATIPDLKIYFVLYQRFHVRYNTCKYVCISQHFIFFCENTCKSNDIDIDINNSNRINISQCAVLLCYFFFFIIIIVV